MADAVPGQGEEKGWDEKWAHLPREEALLMDAFAVLDEAVEREKPRQGTHTTRPTPTSASEAVESAVPAPPSERERRPRSVVRVVD